MTLHRNIRTTAEYQAIDAAHHWHPFTDTKDLNAKGARVIVKAEGVWLTDSEGARILDGMAGLWCVNVGYGREEIVEAVARQMRELPYYNTFFQCTHPAAAEFAEALCAQAPAHMNRVFFTNSGSEANDTVFRLARVYWDCMGKPSKKIFIARRNGYHGSTVAAASLGGMAPMHAQSGLPIEGVRHIGQPYWFGEGRDSGMTPEEFGLARARELEAMIDELGADNVCAFVAEPIQGAGGVVIPPDSYWPEIQRICRERDILLVADEVICGFGRTGAWWGSETFGIEPDLMPIAKGMTSGYQPMGGVLISDRVAGPVIDKAGEFFHGFTYSGHPAAAAAGLANLRIMQEERLVERAARIAAPRLAQVWRALADHPLVGEARCRGLVGALELVRSKPDMARFPEHVGAGALCRDLSVRNGLVMRAVGDTMIIAPPLVISEDEIDELGARARRTLDDLAERLEREGAL
ncbi:aspartate aminotransferase family protein [Oceanicella actignis]|uniref:Putrescine aminotransferase n=1 Tax=Oceanicella actignis TaxID=1189325 RepID=A0A1M7TEQ4_9RHOB|nr:aspartate aminotransferase family protein [Oceanicella actignis]TYO88586.1 putrescine aminotransferase [Oceanicella actignis]SET62246.1 putrescine aminotransferase [Oceanicella actignis]SHN69133.1 putrescine aminotransferase [Oceanicella actignis]